MDVACLRVRVRLWWIVMVVSVVVEWFLNAEFVGGL